MEAQKIKIRELSPAGGSRIFSARQVSKRAYERKIFPKIFQKSIDIHDPECYNKNIKKSKEAVNMKTCGNCKYCKELNVCGCDCKCLARSTTEIDFEVSKDDEITWYGDNDKPCEFFEEIQ